MVKTLIKNEYISPKISKEEIKILFNILHEGDLRYYLVCMLMYVYGRIIKEVYQMKKEDVDFENKIVKFKINNEYVEYSLVDFLISDLESLVSESIDYLFISNPSESIDNYSSKLNYYLKKYDAVNNVHISPRDFKKLRGQHLLLDGVCVKSISRLYHSNDNSATKRLLIDSEELLRLSSDDVEVILNHFTDI